MKKRSNDFQHNLVPECTISLPEMQKDLEQRSLECNYSSNENHFTNPTTLMNSERHPDNHMSKEIQLQNLKSAQMMTSLGNNSLEAHGANRQVPPNRAQQNSNQTFDYFPPMIVQQQYAKMNKQNSLGPVSHLNVEANRSMPRVPERQNSEFNVDNVATIKIPQHMLGG